MIGHRYAEMFARTDAENRGAFIPFLVVGDPMPELFLAAAQGLIDAGADALELGIPFSDPTADGPVVQAAVNRALAAGVTPGDCFALIAQLRRQNSAVPVGILTYANAVFQQPFDVYFQRAFAAGIDAVLTADLPIAEADTYAAQAEQCGVCPVFIAPPDAPEEALRRIAQRSKGYTYVVSRSGVTGCDAHLSGDFRTTIARLKTAGAARPVVGFGISEASHVAQVVQAGAAGAISGSRIVDMLHRAFLQNEDLRLALSPFVEKMKRATKREPNVWKE